MTDKIQQIIEETSLIQGEDKQIVLNYLDRLTPLELLKFEKNLISGTVSSVLEQVQDIKNRISEEEKQKEQSENNPKKEVEVPVKRILSTSVLTQKNYLGAEPPKAVAVGSSQPLPNLEGFVSLSQLSLLAISHVTFGINDNSSQIVRDFLEKLEKLFSKVEQVEKRRDYLMNFLQSELFASYLNTGITALRHPEIEPAKIILNTLHQINPNYLNTNQFQYASIICNQLRSLCAL